VPISDIATTSTAIMEPRGLRIRDAVAYSGLTPWAIRTAIWAGRLPAKKSGRGIIILRSDLDSFLDNLPTTETNNSEWFINRQKEPCNAMQNEKGRDRAARRELVPQEPQHASRSEADEA